MYRGDDLRDLSFDGQFGLLDLLDPLIAFFRKIGQIVLETHHTVVGRVVRSLFDAVLFGNLPCLLFTLPEGLAQIISGNAALVRKWPSLGAAKQVAIICETSLDVSAVIPAMQKYHQIRVVDPLVTDYG
ncbi:hypothetical protein [Mycobacterium sp. pR1184]|uniref:hypothetical protein n=1 Tax=Mycobacterium sp. pR1184 TaxID=3238981 RepID=UPI00351BD575